MAGSPGDDPDTWSANNPGNPNFNGFDFGVLYDNAHINTAIGLADTYGIGANQIAQTVNASEHGTHVAGIAAGSGHVDPFTDPAVNIGAAPEADIVHVTTDFDEDHVIDALNFIYAVGAHLGRPVVINVSIGTHFGPHDGQSTSDTGRDAMLNSFLGRSMVYAAGNDNNDPAFRTGTVQANQTEPGWTLTATPPAWPPGSTETLLLDIWYVGPELDYRISSGGASTGWRTAGQEFHNVTDGLVNGQNVGVWRDFEARAGRRNLTIQILNTAAVWTIDLRNPGANDVTYWAWGNGSGEATIQGATDGEMTLSDWACAKALLTVGSCNKPVGGNPMEIVDYSGRGPTWDQRIKPEIVAVGDAPVGRVESTNSGTMGGYVSMGGTSMASPLGAGAIALLLEVEPDLYQDGIKALLCQTADRTNLDIDPAAAGYDPLERNAYGYGRLMMVSPYLHTNPLVDIDPWIRSADDDYGLEPFPGDVYWMGPDVRILTLAGVETTTLTWGQEYRVQVRVHNLGDMEAQNTLVKIRYTRPCAAPDDWVQCQDSADNAIEQRVDIPALGFVDIELNQRWRPQQAEMPEGGTNWGDKFCFLTELDHANDPLQYDNAAGAGGNAWSRNIKGTNNCALKNLHIQ